MTAFVPGGPPRFAHQKAGLRRMIETKGTTALLWEPGTGKTAATIDFLGVLTQARARQGHPQTRVLVACPLVAVDTWVSQMEEYASPQIGFWAEALGGSIIQRAEALAARGGQPFSRTPGAGRQKRATLPQRARLRGLQTAPEALHAERSRAVSWRQPEGCVEPMSLTRGPGALCEPGLVLEVVNLDTFSSRAQVGSKTMADVLLEAVKRFDPELMIIDEAHRVKGVSSNVSRVMARIGKRVPRRIILTGTVMPHSPMDVYAQWRFLDPEAFAFRHANGTRAPMSHATFQDRYARMGGWMGRQIVGYQRLEEMQSVMAERASVVRKSDALDLPPTSDVVIPVNLSPAETKAYADMKKLLVATLDGTTVMASNRLAQMMRLRQITAGALPGQVAGQQQGPTAKSSKIRVVRSLVQDTLSNEKRVVIFALFRDEIRALELALIGKGTEVLTITGDTPIEDRISMRKRFGSEDPARLVMVAQIRTMSLAVNELVTASHAIFATLPQQRDDLVQARDRLNRLGQTKPVTFWYAIAPGTVDQVVMDTHAKRGNLEQNMLRHVRGN